MFTNTKRSGRKQNNEMVENVKKETLSKIDSSIVVPLIFTSEGSVQFDGLIEYPIKFSNKMNNWVYKDCEDFLKPLTEGSLRVCDSANRKIALNEIIFYIKNMTFVNFCSAINSSSYNEYFSMIPILNNVWEKLNACDILIEDLLISLYSPYSEYKFDSSQLGDSKRIMETQALAKNISLQISQTICLAICEGCEEAVNDTVMQVHTVPNIKDLYKKLAQDKTFLKGLDKCNIDLNYPLFAASYIKTIMKSIIHNLMYRFIGPNVENIITSSLLSLFYVYNDYLYYDFEAASKQVVEYEHQRLANDKF